MSATKLKPHSMSQKCVCGAKFFVDADSLKAVLEAFYAWWAEHQNCGGDK